jgi:hypothetical protein
MNDSDGELCGCVEERDGKWCNETMSAAWGVNT